MCQKVLSRPGHGTYIQKVFKKATGLVEFFEKTFEKMFRHSSD